MQRNGFSDIDPTMAASLAFEEILIEIQESNLNYRIERSPYSAVIYLKKSSIKNKFETASTTPPPSKSLVIKAVKSENLAFIQKIEYLENVIERMKNDHQNLVLDSENCYRTIERLETQLSENESEAKKV